MSEIERTLASSLQMLTLAAYVLLAYYRTHVRSYYALCHCSNIRYRWRREGCDWAWIAHDKPWITDCYARLDDGNGVTDRSLLCHKCISGKLGWSCGRDPTAYLALPPYGTATVWLGATALTRVDIGVLTTLIGLLLVAYSGPNLAGIRLTIPRHSEGWTGPIFGAVNGILTGMTGSFVVPGVMYLQGIGLSRDILVQAMGMLFKEQFRSALFIAIVLLGIFILVGAFIPFLIVLLRKF